MCNIQFCLHKISKTDCCYAGYFKDLLNQKQIKSKQLFSEHFLLFLNTVFKPKLFVQMQILNMGHIWVLIKKPSSLFVRHFYGRWSSILFYSVISTENPKNILKYSYSEKLLKLYTQHNHFYNFYNFDILFYIFSFFCYTDSQKNLLRLFNFFTEEAF